MEAVTDEQPRRRDTKELSWQTVYYHFTLRYYTGDPRASILSSLSVNLAQPLLRGFGRNNPEVEALTQAERNVVYAVRDFA